MFSCSRVVVTGFRARSLAGTTRKDSYIATSLSDLSTARSTPSSSCPRLHDQAGRRDHAVGALLARQPRIFLDAVERDFGGAAEDRKHRAVFQEIDRVIAPLAGCDHAAIEAENAVEFAPGEGDLAGDGGLTAARAPALLARFGFAESHAAPPCVVRCPDDRAVLAAAARGCRVA